ncbi:MAG: hypothetical protein K2L16_10530 [Muribaculaceae bacterium]|nr:hypothetical protein [Muribaculaceae bacterium]
MKKLLFLLLAALPLAFVSCSDDNDLPDVDFTLTVSGATNVDGTLYVVQGENMVIESITVTNRENGKGAMISSASYYWDGYYLGAAVQPPYGFEIETSEETPAGRHTLEIVSPLFAVDKTMATAVLVYNVQVVPTAEDIPEGGTNTFTGTPTVSDSSN